MYPGRDLGFQGSRNVISHVTIGFAIYYFL